MKHSTQLLTFLLICVTMSTAANAQNTRKEPSTLQRILMKHHISEKELEKPKREVEMPKNMSRAKDASGAPLLFPNRVWFPGEWEEVKAVVVTPLYYYVVKGHEDDNHYSAIQLVKNWGDIFYQEAGETYGSYLGRGECESRLDLQSNGTEVPLYIMDGIQQAGAEAWVRIEEEGDEALIREAMTRLGLRTDKMQFFVAPGNAIWYRDCGPICFYYGDDDNLAMLDFLYSSRRACDDLLPSFIHRKFDIPNYINDVVWEGGNCLVDGLGGLVTSTHTYSNNLDTVGRLWWDGADTSTIRFTKKSALSRSQVKAALSGLVGQRQTTILPMLNYDGGTGHVDLYADAIDENYFLLAQMPDEYAYWSDYDIAYFNSIILLNQNNFFGRPYYDGGALPFPAKDDGSSFSSEEDYDNKYTRSYANHLLCNNYILQPCFSPVDENHMPTAEWDRANIEKMKTLYPGYTFYCIDMRSFDSWGGSIHCVTKQIPADNPIRIIHKNIYGKVNPSDNVPFSAIITNKSGIKEARLVYSVNEGGWTEVPLTANGNCWSTSVALDNFTGGKPLTAEGIIVDYYISATSNNGKTVTKPINAKYGQYHYFTLTNDVNFDANAFDYNTQPMSKEKITFELDTRWLIEDTSIDIPPTAIREVKSSIPDGGWYTLSGLRLSSRPSAKGIYIFNGKKVVIK